ncbi:AbrB/MazE/SpoVT family DNA-binding domain-containing protein [Caproiciproducens sp. CPB-2]|uniref:AbrB/MazE/SpoVT family DNA-binding domain-containing protein n=1 Tax=Caproiciproducens sp. CPB-2 TaxID=3030017 RepID=UPI0023DA050D|nr:AbrB/MazE/SpoVT family DNA-binding domain-containing protein [Caproiciproducens sp. CPB-2]MDF1493792.1 AbrB/MazE/SpoVT family DNA-binding domain-containing protein [Caproiciproducens sp. CPB-2]
MERKIIRVSMKRQVTLPQKYFEVLGFQSEAECVLQDDGILIRPVRDSGGDDFSEQILADLISQGISGQELLDKFKEQSKKVHPAIKKLIAEADSLAESDQGKKTLDEIFGTED